MSELELTAAPAPPRLWTTVREALAGSHQSEYTDGPIGRAILLLAVPMVLARTRRTPPSCLGATGSSFCCSSSTPHVPARPLGFGPAGVFWAMAIAFSAQSVVSALLFRRGAWKLKRV